MRRQRDESSWTDLGSELEHTLRSGFGGRKSHEAQWVPCRGQYCRYVVTRCRTLSEVGDWYKCKNPSELCAGPSAHTAGASPYRAAGVRAPPPSPPSRALISTEKTPLSCARAPFSMTVVFFSVCRTLLPASRASRPWFLNCRSLQTHGGPLGFSPVPAPVLLRLVLLQLPFHHLL